MELITTGMLIEAVLSLLLVLGIVFGAGAWLGSWLSKRR